MSTPEGLRAEFNRFAELIGRYWDLGYKEGASGESYGDAAGEALGQIHALFRSVQAAVQHESDCVEVARGEIERLETDLEVLRNTGDAETVRQLQVAFAAEIAEWRETMSGLSSMLSEGLGSDTTTASDFAQRIQHGINRILLVEEQRRVKAQTERDAFEANDRRYKWLRDDESGDEERMHVWRADGTDVFTGAELDAAIDAELAKVAES